MATERHGPTQNRVIVLSDGHANRGLVEPGELGHHAAELRKRGLYTSTVGIGDNYSPVQLDAIAEHGGGRPMTHRWARTSSRWSWANWVRSSKRRPTT